MGKNQVERFMDKCQMQADISGVKVHAYQVGPHAFKMILGGEERPAGVHVGTREPQRWTPLERIHKAESDIINASTAVLEIGQLYEKESIRGRSPLVARNRDSWGTLYVNAHKLREQLTSLIRTMDKEFAADAEIYVSQHDSNGNA